MARNWKWGWFLLLVVMWGIECSRRSTLLLACGGDGLCRCCLGCRDRKDDLDGSEDGGERRGEVRSLAAGAIN
jgi:hypothetical protein